MEEACWDPAREDDDSSTPGLITDFVLPSASPTRDAGLPPVAPWPCLPLLPRAISTGCSGSDGGEGGCDVWSSPASCSPGDDGEASGSSETTCVCSDTWESQEESRLGLEEREESPEESWDEC